MCSDLKIVIPSHKRADRVKCKKLLVDPILCVAESQKEEYAYYNPELEIVTHPDSVIGLIPKRNWMYNHFGKDLFMVDDDVNAFHSLTIVPGEAPNIKDKVFITRKVQELHELAQLLECSVYGFTNKYSPVMFHTDIWYALNYPITGCAYGCLPSENVWWNENLKLKEDYWISSYMKHKERKILVSLLFNFVQTDTFVNPGGLSAIRNHDEEMRTIMEMRKYFGESVRLKGFTTNGKDVCIQKVENNISIVYPY